MNKSGSKIRVGSGGRLMTPRSSCGYAFDSTEYSDEEGTEVSTGQDVLLTYENLNSSAEVISLSVCSCCLVYNTYTDLPLLTYGNISFELLIKFLLIRRHKYIAC